MAENKKEPESKKPEGKEEEEHQLLAKLEEIRQALVIKTSDDVADLLKLSRSTRRILVTNLLLGLSRGVGFFIGVTFLGGLLVILFLWIGDNVSERIGASKEWQGFMSTISNLNEVIEKAADAKENAKNGTKKEEKKKNGETGETNGTNGSKPDRKDPPPD